MTRSFKICETSTAYADIGELHHEYDERGCHRLVMVDKQTAKYSQFYSYAEIALLEYKGTRFAATTEYYDVELPEIFIIYSLKKHHLGEPIEEPKKIKIVKPAA